MAKNQVEMELKTPCLLEKPKPPESVRPVTRRILRSSHRSRQTNRDYRQSMEMKMLKELRLLNVVKAGELEEERKSAERKEKNSSSIQGRSDTLPNINNSGIFVHARSAELHPVDKNNESIDDGKTNIVIKVPELIMDDDFIDDDGAFQFGAFKRDAGHQKRTLSTCDAVQVVGGHVSNLSADEDVPRKTTASSHFVTRVKKHTHFPILPVHSSQPEGIFLSGNNEYQPQGVGLRTPRYLVSPNKQTTPYDTFHGVKTLSSRWLNELSDISSSTKSENDDNKTHTVRLAVPRTANPIARALRLESSRIVGVKDGDSDSSGSTTNSPKCKSARHFLEVDSQNSHTRGMQSNRGTVSASLFRLRQGLTAWPYNGAASDDESGRASVSEVSMESEWPTIESPPEKVVVPVTSNVSHSMYNSIGLPYKHSFTAQVQRESKKTISKKGAKDQGKCVKFQEEPKIHNIEFPRSSVEHTEEITDIREDKLLLTRNKESQKLATETGKFISKEKQTGEKAECQKAIVSKVNISDDPVKRKVCTADEINVSGQGTSSYSMLDKKYTNHARQKRSRTPSAPSPTNVMFKQKDYVGFQHKKFIKKNSFLGATNTGTSAFPSGYIDTNKKIPYLKVKIREDE